jgi:3-deoxy-D-manno-octulosonic-acid transferase
LNTVFERFHVTHVTRSIGQASVEAPEGRSVWEHAAMVGEVITFLHRHVRIVTPAVVLVWAAGLFALFHLFTPH